MAIIGHQKALPGKCLARVTFPIWILSRVADCHRKRYVYDPDTDRQPDGTSGGVVRSPVGPKLEGDRVTDEPLKRLRL